MAENGAFLRRVLRAADAVAGAESAADAGRMLEQQLPEFVTAIGHDRAAGAFARWGLSTALDESVGRPVITPALFEALHALAAIDARWPVGNAGLMHLYGYLLSTVDTPFGFKRDRWVGDALYTALGMPGGAVLDALTSGGAPLSLVSDAIDHVLDAARRPIRNRRIGVAVDDERGGDGERKRGYGRESDAHGEDERARGSGHAERERGGDDDERESDAHGDGEREGCGGDGARASGPIERDDDAGETAIVAVVDEFAGEEREEVARATLVQSTGEPGIRALLYTIELGSTRRLITAFPVEAQPDAWLASFTSEPPRLRYNAVAHELPARSPLAGRIVR